MTAPSTSVLARARRDARVFAELLVGEPLFDYQAEVAVSPARTRVICAGRQVGKSRLLTILALHRAFADAGSHTLIVSAGEAAAKRLLREIAGLVAGSALLAGSVVDETSQLVTLSNGSWIRAVPASMAQIRGETIHLLIVDEAGFITDEIWQAASATTIAAGPTARTVLASTPWNTPDHFFRSLWQRGMDGASAGYESWHWPSSVSPLVTDDVLEDKRQTTPPAKFAREYLADWEDSVGAFFTQAELADATSDEPMLPVDEWDGRSFGWAVGGVDWGMRADAHALTVVQGRPEPDERGRPRYAVRWVEERFKTPYDVWIERLAVLAGRFEFAALTSETNGVNRHGFFAARYVVLSTGCRAA